MSLAVGAVPCPTCGRAPDVSDDGYVGWRAVCENCYDCDCVGDPPQFVSSSPTGFGRTRDEALADWADAVSS